MNNKIIKAGLLVFLGVIIILLVILFPRSDAMEDITKTEVRVQFFNSEGKPDNLPFHIANKKGFFEKRGINVLLNHGIAVADQVNLESYSENFDILIMGRANAYATEADMPNYFKIFLASVNTSDFPDYALIAQKDSNFSELSDLENARLGLEVSSGKAREVLSTLILEANFINPEEVTIIKTSSIDDLRNDEIDILYLREPQLSVALASGEYKVIEEAPVLKYIMNPWPMGFAMMSQKFIDENPEAALEVVEAWNEAVQYIRDNQVEAGDILNELVREAYNSESAEVEQTSFWLLEEFDKEIIQKQINLYYDKGLINRQFNIGDLILSLNSL